MTDLIKITKAGGGFHEFKHSSRTEDFPNAFAQYLRSYGEIYFWKKGNFHVVTRAEHARQVLMSPDYTADRSSFFISRMPKMDLSLIQEFFGVVKNMMVMSDGEDHAKRRKAANAGFEDSILERFKSTMKKTVQSLVADIQHRQSFEFVERVSKRLPSTVLAELFSIPEGDRADFLKYSNIMTGFFGGASQYRNEDGIEVNNAALALKNYFSRLVEERSKNPGEDYVSLVLQAAQKRNLCTDELISQLVMMLVAGMATTTDQINNSMFLLASHSDIQDQVRADKNLIPPMLEEFKRYDPAVTFIFRVAKNNTQIGNQPIAAGEVIFISNHAVNRDLPEDQRPLELDIHRKVPHFAYGHGAHYCLGAKLARMEIISLFEELLNELPPFEIDPGGVVERDHYSASFSGFKSLPLRLKHSSASLQS